MRLLAGGCVAPRDYSFVADSPYGALRCRRPSELSDPRSGFHLSTPEASHPFRPSILKPGKSRGAVSRERDCFRGPISSAATDESRLAFFARWWRPPDCPRFASPLLPSSKLRESDRRFGLSRRWRGRQPGSDRSPIFRSFFSTSVLRLSPLCRLTSPGAGRGAL